MKPHLRLHTNVKGDWWAEDTFRERSTLRFRQPLSAIIAARWLRSGWPAGIPACVVQRQQVSYSVHGVMP